MPIYGQVVRAHIRKEDQISRKKWNEPACRQTGPKSHIYINLVEARYLMKKNHRTSWGIAISIPHTRGKIYFEPCVICCSVRHPHQPLGKDESNQIENT